MFRFVQHDKTNGAASVVAADVHIGRITIDLPPRRRQLQHAVDSAGDPSLLARHQWELMEKHG